MYIQLDWSVTPAFHLKTLFAYLTKVCSAYRQVDLDVDEYYMLLTHVDTLNQVYLQFVAEESEATAVQYRNQLLESLESISVTLQAEAPNYPKLDIARPG